MASRKRKTRKEERRDEFSRMIAQKMFELKISQRMIGEEWGITQAGAGVRIRGLILDYEALVTLFDYLEFTDEEILRAMRHDRRRSKTLRAS